MTTENKYSVQAENKRIADTLRRMAERVERSTRPYCWHMQATAGDPVSISAAPLDEPGVGAVFGAVRAAVVIGDEDFVMRMKDHLRAEK